MRSLVQEHQDDEVGKLSVELKGKMALEDEEHQKLAKENKQRMVEEEIEYYKSLILTKVESLLISEDRAPFYQGGIDEIQMINRGIREQDKMTKHLAFNLLKNLLEKHGIKRGYINFADSNLPLDFLNFLAETMK